MGLQGWEDIPNKYLLEILTRIWTFLTISRVMLTLLPQGPHFKDHCPGAPASVAQLVRVSPCN